VKPLLTRGRWGIYSDDLAVWLCANTLLEDEHYCSGRFCHTFPRIHRGALRWVRPWYAPWQTPRWCVQWVVRRLEQLTAVATELGSIRQALADQQEIEHILETL